MYRTSAHRLASWLREVRRESSIRRLGMLRGEAPRELQRLTEAAARAFDAPLALLSVADGPHLRVRAVLGVQVDVLPRCDSFCQHALDQPADLLEATDPLADPRFADLPSVAGAPGVRYYAGAPLRVPGGSDLGVLCVLDLRRRPPASDDQRAYLRALARQAVHRIEAHHEFGRAAA